METCWSVCVLVCFAAAKSRDNVFIRVWKGILGIWDFTKSGGDSEFDCSQEVGFSKIEHRMQDSNNYEKKMGCSVLMKKEQECRIMTPLSPPPIPDAASCLLDNFRDIFISLLHIEMSKLKANHLIVRI